MEQLLRECLLECYGTSMPDEETAIARYFEENSTQRIIRELAAKLKQKDVLLPAMQDVSDAAAAYADVVEDIDHRMPYSDFTAGWQAREQAS